MEDETGLRALGDDAQRAGILEVGLDDVDATGQVGQPGGHDPAHLLVDRYDAGPVLDETVAEVRADEARRAGHQADGVTDAGLRHNRVSRMGGQAPRSVDGAMPRSASALGRRRLRTGGRSRRGRFQGAAYNRPAASPRQSAATAT